MWSFLHICKKCQEIYIVPNPVVKELECGLKVLSFFPYDEIAFLLKSKHKDLGYYIYTLLAEKTMPYFANYFAYDQKLSVVPVDDRVKEGFSHTAIIARALRSPQLKPSYDTLHATSDLSYSGKPLAFRLANPRDFRMKTRPPHEVLLVDDIVTTGTTLCEASAVLKKNSVTTLMAVVLADASR